MSKRLTLPFIATLCAVALCAAVGVKPANAAAGDIYNLGTLGGISSAAYGVNDAGQVVGSAQDAEGRSRAFLWESSQGMTDLGTANGYTEARAHAISPSGSVVGVQFDNATGISHAFTWTPNDPNGTMGTLTGLASGDYSTAADINVTGHVVGSSIHYVPDETCTPDNPYYPNCGGAGYYESRAVMWENGVIADLTSLLLDNQGFTLEAATAINNAGQVTGQSYSTTAHAFRYDDTPGSGGVMHDLGTLGGTTSIGRAINAAGQVVGDSWTTGDAGQHAFRYIGTPGAGGVMIDLGTLGGATSAAIDVNNAGFIVGDADRAGGGSWATLWQNDAGNTAIDLDAWLDATNPTSGAYWGLTEARGINNDGLITGQGIYDDGPGGLSDGYRAFVLDASSLTAAPHFVLCDFNGDTVVDAADLASWKTGFGTTGAATRAQGDADGDNDVDGGDFLAWQRQLGAGPSATVASIAVPEPATFVLMIVAAAGWCQRRRRTE